ncbi:MAG: hypothetical protein BM562_04275 [Alphaproteobacteria bacterium MedPE-SWcel]|nr:MAG: hypothetical protein BM562_04275 [Alphaproteobacteria bacterium MedPE-SWcel]
MHTRISIVLGVDELYDTGNGEDYANRMSVFVLSGDALPSISTAAEWLAFEDSITGTGYPSGTYAPNQDILLSSFFPSSSEDDEVYGTAGDDLIETGAGNDNIYGNGGDDMINGGDDEDWMVVNRHNATLDGGEGGEDFDDAVIYDYGNTDVLVEFDPGNEEGSVIIQGRTDLDDAGTAEYTVTGSNIERVVLDTDGEALIEGNDNDNRIRLNEVQGVFTFNGGGGTDQIDLHRTWVEDDGGNRIRGISLDFFLENTRLEGSADSLTIYDADDDSLVGVLNDVEVLRFSDRTLTVVEVLAMDQAGEGDVITGDDSREDLTGTSDNDTITGGGDTTPLMVAPETTRSTVVPVATTSMAASGMIQSTAARPPISSMVMKGTTASQPAPAMTPSTAVRAMTPFSAIPLSTPSMAEPGMTTSPRAMA